MEVSVHFPDKIGQVLTICSASAGQDVQGQR